MSEVSEHGELRVEDARGAPLMVMHHRHATGQRVMVDSGDVDGNPVAGADARPRFAERLECAHPTGDVPGLDHDIVVDREKAAGEGAGHDGAGTPRREDTIDPKPRPTAIRRGERGLDESIERSAQLVETDTERGGHLDEIGGLEKRARDTIGDVELHDLQVIVVDEIDLRERDHAVRDPEQLEDAEVLLALGLPSLGRGDDEEAAVDRADAREHVLDEPHVTGDVDERDARARTAAGPTRTRGRW